MISEQGNGHSRRKRGEKKVSLVLKKVTEAEKNIGNRKELTAQHAALLLLRLKNKATGIQLGRKSTNYEEEEEKKRLQVTSETENAEREMRGSNESAVQVAIEESQNKNKEERENCAIRCY